MKRTIIVLLAVVAALMYGACSVNISLPESEWPPAPTDPQGSAQLHQASTQVGSNFFTSETPEFVFRYAENQPLNYPTTQGALQFAKLVEEKTGGRIKIVVYHGAQLGDEISVIEQMQFGGIDFARASIGTLAEFSKAINVLQLPYLYRDNSHMWTVLDGEIGDDFLVSVSDFGVVGLSWYDAGARSFYNSKKKITRLEDLKGMNIRVQESSLISEMVRALGANPMPMVFSEVYSALQIGTIDGAENNWPSFESALHYEVAKYFVLDEHTRVPEMQIISRTTMEKLSDADMEIIRECARESALFERKEWTKREKASKEKVARSGVVITTLSGEENQKFQDACKPLYEKFCADYMDIVEKIIATD